jgi:DNA-binding MarR family transcriptional regulator
MVVVVTEDVPTSRDYRRLLALRTGLRLFLRWSEAQAKAQGLTPTQHQLLLAIRGHSEPHGPTIGEIADYLVIRHNSAVGLVDRAAAAGLVVREADGARPGVVRVRCTELGASRLDALSRLHAAELSRLTPTMDALWHALDEGAAGAG